MFKQGSSEELLGNVLENRNTSKELQHSGRTRHEARYNSGWILYYLSLSSFTFQIYFMNDFLVL